VLNDPEQIIIADSRYVKAISLAIPSRRDRDQSNAKGNESCGGENVLSREFVPLLSNFYRVLFAFLSLFKLSYGEKTLMEKKNIQE